MDREKGYVDIYDAVSEGTKPLRELYQKIYGEIKGIPTGFTEVDKIVGALRKKDLILLAARPGMGKTTWALRVANNNAMSRSNKVLVFSLELSNAQLGKWLFTMDTGVTPEIIKKVISQRNSWSVLLIIFQALEMSIWLFPKQQLWT